MGLKLCESLWVQFGVVQQWTTPNMPNRGKPCVRRTANGYLEEIL